MEFFRKSPVRPILFLAFVLHFLFAGYAAYRETPTVDEYAHLPAGLAYWKYGEFGLYSKNPPLFKQWATLPLVLGAAGSLSIPKPQVEHFGWGPWLYGLQFETLNSSNYLRAFFISRLMVLAISLAAGGLFFCLAGRFMAEEWAALMTFAFLLSPTVLAHGHLVTTDMACLFSVLTFLWVLFHPERKGWAVGLGFAFAVACAVKFTGLFLLPAFVLGLCFFLKSADCKKTALTVATAVFCAWIALAAFFGFHQLFAPLGEMTFHSHLFLNLQEMLPRYFPSLVPADYIQGLDAQLGDAEKGEIGNYLFGEWSREGWWYYGLVAFFFKEPLLTSLLLLVAAGGFAFSGFRAVREQGARIFQKISREFWILLVAFLSLAIPLFLNPIQVGLRYFLPLYPFVFLWIGIFLSKTVRSRKKDAVLIGLAVLWLISAASVAPDFLRYFNLAAKAWGAPENILLDSNLDWGQDLYRVAEYQKTLPPNTRLGLLYFGHVSPKQYDISFELPPDHREPGLWIVSPNFLKGMPYMAPIPGAGWTSVNPAKVEWLRHFEPVERLGSLLVFEVK